MRWSRKGAVTFIQKFIWCDDNKPDTISDEWWDKLAEMSYVADALLDRFNIRDEELIPKLPKTYKSNRSYRWVLTNMKKCSDIRTV